jgi:hypothetical protein
MGGVLRVNSGSEKISAVLTDTCGTSTKYHGSSGSTGVSFSPTPSAKAAWPRTKTGTSAPSVRPSVARRSSVHPSCQRWFTAHGQDFIDPDVDPKRAAGLLLQLSCGANDQIAVVWDSIELGVQTDHTVIANGESDFITVIKKLKNRLQLVITVFAAAEDVQHQIELGRRGQGQARSSHVHCPNLRGCHSLITSVTSRSVPCSLMRSGNQKPFCSA